MSYGMGSKWVPGQIAFTSTPDGRLPNVQPLIEAGLPYAPYVEHGSWAAGRPDIARYGRDPYHGLSSAPSSVPIGSRGFVVLGVIAGAGAGLGGALTRRWWLGTVVGAALGGAAGHFIGKRLVRAPAAIQDGLGGVLAVM